MIRELSQVAKGVLQTSSSAVASSATGANLAAAAAVLPSMHMAGMALVDVDSLAGGLDRLPEAEAWGAEEPSVMSTETPRSAESAVSNHSFDGAGSPPGVTQGGAGAVENVRPIGQYDVQRLPEVDAGNAQDPMGSQGPLSMQNGNSVESPATVQTGVHSQSSSQGSTPASAPTGGAAAQFAAYGDVSSSVGGEAETAWSVASETGITVRSSGPGIYEGTDFDDLLIGSNEGGDFLVGKAGNDTYVVQDASTSLVEGPGQGDDQLFVAVQAYGFESAIETVSVLPTVAYDQFAMDVDPLADGLYSGWQVTGSSLTTLLVGGDGGDWFYGGSAYATYAGGLGNDVYSINQQQQVSEGANAGVDIVVASANYVMNDYVEILVADSLATDLSLTGNAQNNLIIGNLGANWISAGLGDDTIVGGGGDDFLIGGEGINTFMMNSADAFMGELGDFKTGVDQLLIGVDDPTMTLSVTQNQFNGVAGEVLEGNGHWMFDWDGDANFDSILSSQNHIALSDIELITHDQIPTI